MFLLCRLQEIINRMEDIKEAGRAMRACEWAVSKLRTDVISQQVAETKQIASELDMENKRIKTLRKARMKEFLEQEAMVFEAQLNAQGKAFWKER